MQKQACHKALRNQNISDSAKLTDSGHKSPVNFMQAEPYHYVEQRHSSRSLADLYGALFGGDDDICLKTY